MRAPDIHRGAGVEELALGVHWCACTRVRVRVSGGYRCKDVLTLNACGGNPLHAHDRGAPDGLENVGEDGHVGQIDNRKRPPGEKGPVGSATAPVNPQKSGGRLPLSMHAFWRSPGACVSRVGSSLRIAPRHVSCLQLHLRAQSAPRWLENVLAQLCRSVQPTRPLEIVRFTWDPFSGRMAVGQLESRFPNGQRTSSRFASSYSARCDHGRGVCRLQKSAAIGRGVVFVGAGKEACSSSAHP